MRTPPYSSATSVTSCSPPPGETMGVFERCLGPWLAPRIGAGVFLGHVLPGFFRAFGRMKLARVNVPVAVLIWPMVVPVLLKISLRALHHVSGH